MAVPFAKSLSVTDSLATTAWLDMADFTKASFQTAGAVTLTIYGSNDDAPGSDTFVAAADEEGDAITITAVAAGIFQRDDCCSFRYIKVLGSATATVLAYMK